MTLWDESWVKEAACSGMDPNIFYIPRTGNQDDIDYAKSICAVCPVREECLEFALRKHTGGLDSHGIWGGYTVKERRRILRERKYGARRSSQR